MSQSISLNPPTLGVRQNLSETTTAGAVYFNEDDLSPAAVLGFITRAFAPVSLALSPTCQVDSPRRCMKI